MYVSVLQITGLRRGRNDDVQNQDALKLPGTPVKPAMLVYILIVSRILFAIENVTCWTYDIFQLY